MNLRTLIEIVRPDVGHNYSGYPELEKTGVLDKNLALKFELLESDVEAEGDDQYLYGLRSYAIIRNKENGKHYKISYTHDSWSEDPIGCLESAKIELVIPEKVEVINYKTVVQEYLENV